MDSGWERGVEKVKGLDGYSTQGSRLVTKRQTSQQSLLPSLPTAIIYPYLPSDFILVYLNRLNQTTSS
jgi:hypothetical protein